MTMQNDGCRALQRRPVGSGTPPGSGRPPPSLAFRTLAGAGWLAASRLLGRAFDFVTLILLARALGPLDFGLVALAMTFVLIAEVVLDIPLLQAMLRLERVERDHLDTAFSLGLLRGLALASLIMLAVLIGAQVYDEPRLVPVVAVLMVAPIARGMASPAMVHYARALAFRSMFLAELAGKVVAFSAALTALSLDVGYWALAVNYVGASIGHLVASYLLAPYRPRLTLARLDDFASYAGWFSLSQVVSAINWQLDRLLLGRSVDHATLGRFTLATDLSVMPTQTVIGPAMQSVTAAFATLDEDATRRKATFLKAARVAMAVSAPIALGIALTADIIVACLVGPKWVGAEQYLAVLALAVLPVPYYQTIASLCMATGQVRALFEISVIDLAFRVVLVTAGLLLFSVWGVIAARCGVALAMVGFYAVFARRLAGATLFEQLVNLWKIGLAAGCMAVAVILLRREIAWTAESDWLAFAAVASVGGCAYFATLVGSGVWFIVGDRRPGLVDRWW